MSRSLFLLRGLQSICPSPYHVHPPKCSLSSFRTSHSSSILSVSWFLRIVFLFLLLEIYFSIFFSFNVFWSFFWNFVILKSISWSLRRVPDSPYNLRNTAWPQKHSCCFTSLRNFLGLKSISWYLPRVPDSPYILRNTAWPQKHSCFFSSLRNFLVLKSISWSLSRTSLDPCVLVTLPFIERLVNIRSIPFSRWAPWENARFPRSRFLHPSYPLTQSIARYSLGLHEHFLNAFCTEHFLDLLQHPSSTFWHWQTP